MKEKLLVLMQNEGLRSSQLAEILEVNPAGISHIISGRNKPGFDLLQKILRRFPRVNPDWLLLDAPNIYRDDAAASPSSDRETATAITTATPETPPTQPAAPDDLFAPPTEPSEPRAPQSGHRATRIVVFYDNGTFESFTPTSR